jgi:hypothetical protein
MIKTMDLCAVLHIEFTTGTDPKPFLMLRGGGQGNSPTCGRSITTGETNGQLRREGESLTPCSKQQLSGIDSHVVAESV